MAKFVMSWKPAKGLVDLLNHNWPVRKAKAFRNALIERDFRGRGVPEGLKFAEELLQTGSRRFCFVIAFNTPWVIDALTRAWQLYSSGMTLVVIDNSSDRSARVRIADICRARKIAYFGLPRNRESHPNRSHGISMNWIFHNIVRPLRPELFGFLDHDCFPTVPVDIAATMEGKIVHGSKRPAQADPEAWFMWAGFCFFRFSAVQGLDLDFTPRFVSGMDTGGGNWSLLYRGLGENDVSDAQKTAADLDVDGMEADHRMLGGAFFHVGGASHRKLVMTPQYRRLISDYVWETHLGGGESRLVKDP